MKIMLFCWAQEMKTELFHLGSFFADFKFSFIITPLVRLKEKRNYLSVMSQLNKTSKNLVVDPIYLVSQDSSYLNLLHPNILFGDFLSIFRVLNRSRPDVIVCYYVSHAYPLVMLKRIFKFSLCVVAMGSDINLENSLPQRLMKAYVFRNSELIFARSWKLKERIEKEHGYSATVIPSAAESSFFRPLGSKTKLRQKWDIRENSLVILTVCTLNKNKGVDILIKSLRSLESDNVHLLIAGEGVERKSLEELSYALGLQKTVSFLGFKSRDELLELYNLSDIFALASYSEGLPRALIEAMASECIPIVTNVGDAGAVVMEGSNGFLVSPGNHEEFAERFKEVMAFSEETRKLIRSNARHTVMDDFDSQKVTGKMIGYLSTLYLLRNPNAKATATSMS
jgi:glycosyltransferase involved in cell wall biosynthesis